jgi:NAD(P)-dependent dehydrogenase (short-subunit alcohol dehydrogenase family)
MARLAGKVSVSTGGAGGIGPAAGRLFASVRAIGREQWQNLTFCTRSQIA